MGKETPTALLPTAYCPTAYCLLPYCPTALLPYCLLPNAPPSPPSYPTATEAALPWSAPSPPRSLASA
ncbi:hypothetical protein LB528_12320 [Mesorhizobium sp. CA4]|nr:hypothetical protein [Mesorhizobium sp. CA4]MBZ9820243.1 hypothetical protein [Mesorhizobium sp. CA4]